MKLALLLNAVDPLIGGVLIRGQKGTCKSTAARALGRLLPPLRVVADCPYGCDPADTDSLCTGCAARYRSGLPLPVADRLVPVVTLPLNATEEMIVGGLDLEHALRTGARRLQPGLLARANRGVLYIDEVNLLDDRLVDLVLSVAAEGVNRIEREGVSSWHPARFILVGTMNPEEGALRPHFADRFGLCVQLHGEDDPELRAEVMERREAFDRDPIGFAAAFQAQESDLAARIVAAQQALDKVALTAPVLRLITDLCLDHHVAGHRADLAIRRAARALSALQVSPSVQAEQVIQVALLGLNHRRRRPVPGNPPPHTDAGAHDRLDQDGASQRLSRELMGDQELDGESAAAETTVLDRSTPQPGSGTHEQLFAVDDPFPVRPIVQPRDRLIRQGSGRRFRTLTRRTGHPITTIRDRTGRDVALDATIREAAPYQVHRPHRPGMAITIRGHDIHTRVRERRIGNLLVFIIDASSSMGVQARMRAVKGAILSLLLDAYQKRDQVALVSFRDRGAQVLLWPTSSVELAARHLQNLPTGGHTPLSHGLVESYRLIRAHLMRYPSARPIAILITDGRANVPINPGVYAHQEAPSIASKIADEKRVHWIVVDTEAGDMYFGLAAELARRLGAEHLEIADLKAEDLIHLAQHCETID
jgi:magnesium chelatase subunit D